VKERSIHDVFVTGASGYIGRRLVPALLHRGHRVRALVRPQSEGHFGASCDVIVGNVLDRRSFAARVAPSDTLVHLVGTPRPSPAKAKQFREVDLVSIRETVAAATEARVRHLIYVSVAHPAPIMRAYIAVRAEGEEMIRAAGLSATILRPWYVLGPGHRWPHLLRPAYWLMERIDSTRDSAQRLGLITLEDMVHALVAAVEDPPKGIRILAVPDLRRRLTA
jgi:uncharacterized protein YbjT (DUF2867 family)